MSDTSMDDTEHVDKYDQAYARRAKSNVDNWGMQDLDTLLLATQEELGELTQAYLEEQYEGGEKARIENELIDLMALCMQMQWRLRVNSGEPVPYFIEDAS